MRTTFNVIFAFLAVVCISNAETTKIIDKDGRFIAYSNGVVEDTKTGLKWIAGSDRNTTWYEAKRWVERLRVNGNMANAPTKRTENILSKGSLDTQHDSIIEDHRMDQGCRLCY